MKQVYKILPDGNSSGLSLNSFKIYRSNYSRWNGYSGKDIYSLKILKERFLESYPQFNDIDNSSIIEFLEKKCDLETKAYKIIEEIANGLANIVLALYESDKICIQNNKNLFEADWKFWKKCKYIILYGGLISGKLGKKVVDIMSCELESNLVNIKVIKLSDIVKTKTPSLIGCAYDNNQEKQYVFDFGNTAIKRGLAVKNNNEISVKELDSIYHKDFNILPDSIDSAKYVDDYIVKTIIKTVNDFDEKEDKINISMCISNNILFNKLANRGSYRHLCLLGDNYQDHLIKRINTKLNKEANISIYNDVEAVGKIFKGFSKNTAIISFGTLLGIGYPPSNKV